MNIRPLHDRVVVRRLEAKEISEGGIIIPDAAKDKPQEGIVLAVGPGKRSADGVLTPLEVKVGDKILFGRYAGSELEIDKQEVILMVEDDILGVVDGSD